MTRSPVSRSFAYPNLAAIRTGKPGSASFHIGRNSARTCGRQRTCKFSADLLRSPKSRNMNEASGGGVWISEGAECAPFKENRHHEKDRIRFCFACHSSDELQPSGGTEASRQARTGDANA